MKAAGHCGRDVLGSSLRSVEDSTAEKDHFPVDFVQIFLGEFEAVVDHLFEVWALDHSASFGFGTNELVERFERVGQSQSQRALQQALHPLFAEDTSKLKDFCFGRRQLFGELGDGGVLPADVDPVADKGQGETDAQDDEGIHDGLRVGAWLVGRAAYESNPAGQVCQPNEPILAPFFLWMSVG